MRSSVWIACCVIAALAASAPMAQGQSQGQGQGPGQGRRTLEGALEVYYEDSTTGTRLIHILDTGNERIPLRMNGHERRRLRSGDRVRVRGTMTEGTLALDPDGGGGSSLETLSLASSYTFGPQSTLVILFNFQDLTDEPYPRSDAETVNTQVNNFYVENSYGQTSVNGTVVGWYTIAAPSDVCNYNLWAQQADTAATNAGVPVSSFFRRVYGFPPTSACAWWGLGTVGGGSKFFPSRAWVNGPYALQVVAHELGHNFGAYHSRSRTCDAGGCVVIEYGDDHDVMGAALDGHLNAFQKERLGWLGYGSSPSIQTVTTSGDYTLEPYASSNGGLPKALKMLWSSVAGVNTYIYAEARTQVGADSDLTPGVIIHTGVETDGRESYEIDLQPSSSAIDYILSPGQTIIFEGAFSLTTVSSGAFGASLSVTDVLAGTATALTPAPADGTYGGMTTLSATLTADGAPLLGRSIDFTLDGIWVGSATTDASGIATLSGVSLAGFSANTHPTAIGAAFSGDGTYEPSTGTTSLTVAQMPVDPVVTAGNKVYDASNWAALTSCTVSSVVGADEVGCIVMAPPTFASSNVGSGMTVTATQVTLAGPAADNYVLTTTTATTTASIMPRSVTPVVSVAAKSYDGTTAAAITSCVLTGAIVGDPVGCTGTAAFDTAAAGMNLAVTITGVTLTGEAAGNYALSTTTTTTTSLIAALVVSPVVTAADKPYDGTTAATLTSCTVAGALGGDVVACTGTATFDTASVGTGKTVTASGLTLTGAAAGNYALSSTTATTTASITAPANNAPTISNVGAQTTSVGVGVGPLSLTVSDVETPAGSLTLSGSTTNPTLVPVGNIVFGGAGTARTVTVTPAAGQSGTVTITLTVSDGGATSSTSFLLTVTAAPAAVSVDAVGPGPGGASVANGASVSWSHTVGTTGANRLLTVGVAVGRIPDTGLSLAVTYDGVPLTSAGIVHSNNHTSGFVQLFYLTAPATGTHLVQVTLMGGTATIAGGSVSLTGVDQTTPIRHVTTNAGSSALPSVTVASAPGHMVVDALVAGCDGGISSSQIARWIRQVNCDTGGGNGAQSTATGAASVTMGYTVPADWWGMIGMDVVAAM